MSLVTVAFYRTVTGDQDTADAAVTALLDVAQDLVAEALDRDGHLESAAHTETVVIHPDRRAYPKAWPVTVAPSGTEIDPLMGGRALRDVSPDDTTWELGSWDCEPPTATITYTGGYRTLDTGTSSDVPRLLAMGIAQAAAALRVGVLAGVPAGATAVSLGDASVTFARPSTSIDGLVPGLSALLRPYRRREYP